MADKNAAAAAAEHTSRCLCGAVRWRATSPPVWVGWCLCKMCRHHSGAPAAAFAVFPRAAVAVEGATSTYRASAVGQRVFCPACGSSVAWIGDGSDTYDVCVGTADDAEALVPTYEIFAADALSWMQASQATPP